MVRSDERAALDDDAIRAALRQIGSGFLALADALGPERQAPQAERYLALMREWGDRGLDRAAASSLFRKHGLAPQSAGGWVRGDWLAIRPDGMRCLSERSHRWLAEQGNDGHG